MCFALEPVIALDASGSNPGEDVAKSQDLSSSLSNWQASTHNQYVAMLDRKSSTKFRQNAETRKWVHPQDMAACSMDGGKDIDDVWWIRLAVRNSDDCNKSIAPDHGKRST